MSINAQEKKYLTPEDIYPGGDNYFNLLPKSIQGLKWWGDVCIHGDVEQMATVSLKDGQETVLLTVAQANEALATQELGKIHHFMDAQFPDASQPLVRLTTTSHHVWLNWKTRQVEHAVARNREADNTDWCPQGRALAYTLKNNLYVTDNEGQTLQVTDEPEGVKCGTSVHRDEFGIRKGTFWSPKGGLLAFYRMDERMVTDYPQVNTTTRIATLEPDKYPMNGMTSHQVSVGIYNLKTQQTVWLNTGDPTDRYFTNIAWGPDEKCLYLIEVNRDQNEAKLCQYDALTGELTATLITETHPKWVEPETPIAFLPWDSQAFLYTSQMDGYRHLYVCRLDKPATQSLHFDNGTEVKASIAMKQLTQGEWIVQSQLGFNAKAHEVILTSTEVSPLQSNPYAVNTDNGKRRLLGERDGMHYPQLSASGTWLIDHYLSYSIPRRIDLVPTTKGKSVNLIDATEPLEDYKRPEITVGTLKAADGKTDLYYRLIKPVDFDPNKKYPAVIYVYGGPHAQLIHNTRNYDARGWDLYMAQLGYVMLTVDNRGSENRGMEFENAIYRQLGTEEMKDQMKGVEMLKSLPYVDAERIGVHGWSFGGFMTTNLMLTYNDTFKVGVAGGPVIDWNYYEIMYGERYMDTEAVNPEGFKKANLKLRAGDLKGRLQIIIGANDPTCVPQHTVTFLRAAIDAGTQPDFFIYPGAGHNMTGRDRYHLYTRITRYFEDYLK
jgi:dipeptidyl-peptidase-4